MPMFIEVSVLACCGHLHLYCVIRMTPMVTLSYRDLKFQFFLQALKVCMHVFIGDECARVLWASAYVLCKTLFGRASPHKMAPTSTKYYVL